MPSKLSLYMQMADEAQRQITGSYQGWTGFLSTAARLYKYPYAEQVMIHAQRPDATACAEYDFWNEKMGRYVRRGSKGIALIDSSGEKPRLRYVFDVADTGRTEQARTPYLWEYREEHADTVSAMLESRYDVSGENGLPDQLEHIAAQLANEYWNDYQRDILDIVDDSFLNGYDDFNVGVAFRNAATVSITYSLMSRCGLEPENRFDHEDFLPIFDFNTPAAATELGTAVSRISGQVLRQIEVTIKNYEREKNAERSQNHDRTDLHEERRLSDPQPDAERDAGGSETSGQVRETSQELFAGAQTGAVQPSGAEREAVLAPQRDRRDSEPEIGADDAGADESERRDGGTESPRSDEVGRVDEQPESAGRGNDPERAGVQLTPDEPESEPAQPQAAYQLSLFPTEDEQIAFIEQGTSVFDAPVPFSMSIPQEEIDHVLRLAGNRDSGRMNIATEFSKGKSTEEIAEYLKSTFRGGNGIITDHGRYSAWYAENGIHIANGSSSRYLSSAHLWQTVENKQKFISQIMTSKSPVRSCDDVDETALSYAEIKALCAGDERIKEKMDLDVDVARLKLMKANHQSQQFRLEDNLLKTFPEQIRQNEGFIEGFTADLKTLSEHPHPEDGFAGMEVKGDFLTDKDNAGAAILEAFKDAKGMEPVSIGSYRGFAMSLTVEDFGRDFVLTLKGKMNHRVTLGKDARGNLVRIDNALNAIPERMQAVQDKLGTLREQVETAKTELGKPFPQEEELRTKSARLAELNAELNIDDKTPMEQMAEDAPAVETAKAKPSVLAKLKAPLPPRADGKGRQHEQEER